MGSTHDDSPGVMDVLRLGVVMRWRVWRGEDGPLHRTDEEARCGMAPSGLLTKTTTLGAAGAHILDPRLCKRCEWPETASRVIQEL